MHERVVGRRFGSVATIHARGFCLSGRIAAVDSYRNACTALEAGWHGAAWRHLRALKPTKRASISMA